MRKISILGVLLGAVVDIVSSLLLGMPFALFAASRADLTHVPPAQVSAAITAAIHGNIPLYLAELSMGLLGSLLGGIVAAGFAKRAELLNGVLSSFLCLIMGVFLIASGKDSDPFWLQIILLMASPAFALMGGALVRSHRLRRRTASLPQAR